MYEPTILQDYTVEGTRVIVAETCGEVCSRQIVIGITAGRIEDMHFTGGCSGNTQGLAALVRGMKIEDVISRLEGIRCGCKLTSCPDQLARVLKQALDSGKGPHKSLIA